MDVTQGRRSGSRAVRSPLPHVLDVLPAAHDGRDDAGRIDPAHSGAQSDVQTSVRPDRQAIAAVQTSVDGWAAIARVHVGAIASNARPLALWSRAVDRNFVVQATRVDGPVRSYRRCFSHILVNATYRSDRGFRRPARPVAQQQLSSARVVSVVHIEAEAAQPSVAGRP